MTSKTHTEKQKQQKRFILFFGMLALIGGGVYLAFSAPQKAAKTPTKEVSFTNPLKNDQVNSAWLEEFQSHVNDQDQQTQWLKNQIVQMKLDKTVFSKKEETAFNDKYQRLLKQFNALQAKMVKMQQKKPLATPEQLKQLSQNQFPVIPATPVQVPNVAASEGNLSLGIVPSNGDDRLHLTKKPRHLVREPLLNPETYVPSGTHVLGVLLMGADLVSDSDDQSNPKPILIRLIGEGTLPNHHLSHLKNCVITAAMRGDLSSARGNVRLERLSCVRPDHGIIDVAVEGTVASHAKEGINGSLYTREGKRVFSATVAGMLAGTANGVSQGYVNTQQSIFGASGVIDKGALAKYGAFQGASSGLNKLSDFQLNRAEQIHPVIEINGGKLVTVVFTQGFSLVGESQSDTNPENPNALWQPPQKIFSSLHTTQESN